MKFTLPSLLSTERGKTANGGKSHSFSRHVMHVYTSTRVYILDISWIKSINHIYDCC